MDAENGTDESARADAAQVEAAAAAVEQTAGEVENAAQRLAGKVLDNPQSQRAAIAELSRQVAGTGGVEVIIDQRQVERADVIFELLQEQREKVVAGRTSSGSVREFLLRTNLRFRLRTREGKELIPDTVLVATTDISYNETLALSKDQEEQMLYSNMGKDLVGQIVRRMAALTSL